MPPKQTRDSAVSAAPSFTKLVVAPFALAPVFFAALFFVAQNIATLFFEPDPSRAPFLTLPLVGGSLGPGVLGTTLYLLRTRAFSSLPRPVALLLCTLPALLLLGHNFFTVFYGNINNDAWSHSLMIDVVGPPETFRAFTRTHQFFTVATNPATWANESVLAGPHLDVEGIRSASCGPRMFARFMWHRITPHSRLFVLLGKKTMFGGVWVMMEGDDGTRYFTTTPTTPPLLSPSPPFLLLSVALPLQLALHH
jgi:hypothetical protein